jgi:hypothetical protein
MMKPYVFAVCEKVIFDVQGTASLINLFNRVDAYLVTSTEPIPANAIMPFPWSVFTSWDVGPEDVERKFTQVLEVLNPDGSIFNEHRIEIVTQRGKDHHQVEARFPGFPIGQEGSYSVRTRLEQDGIVIFESSAIKIQLTHGSVPTPQPQ